MEPNMDERGERFNRLKTLGKTHIEMMRGVLSGELTSGEVHDQLEDDLTQIHGTMPETNEMQNESGEQACTNKDSFSQDALKQAAANENALKERLGDDY